LYQVPRNAEISNQIEGSGTKSQAITYDNPSYGCKRIKSRPSTLLCDHCGSKIHTDEVYYRTFPCEESFD
jgi:hypothetical protein